MSVHLTDHAGTGDVTRLPAFCFGERIGSTDLPFPRFETLRTLQLNLGNRCNLACAHCHVGASPEGEKIMDKGVIDGAVAFLRRHGGIDLDITGGCPELNPNFSYLIAGTDGLGMRRSVRTNLVIATEKGMTGLPEFYRDHDLALVASLPCFTPENVDRQRGTGVFKRSVAVLRKLNDLGYGDSHELTLVYNPGGDTLPGPQKDLETRYRQELMAGFGIRFTRLIVLTNVPVGRFRGQLVARGGLATYLRTLAETFNPATLPFLMCRSLINVDWAGNLYNCDFNQAVGMALPGDKGGPLHLSDLEMALRKVIPIRFDDHCFACTAGEGSGCFGQVESPGNREAGKYCGNGPERLHHFEG